MRKIFAISVLIITMSCVFVSAQIAQTTTTVVTYDQARTILGNDFISPEEIAKSRGIIYTDNQLAEFRNSLPSQEVVLWWLRDNGFMLIAGPDKPMSLLDIYKLKPEFFSVCCEEDVLYVVIKPQNGDVGSSESRSYETSVDTYSLKDKVDTQWLMIRKGWVPKSANKNWNKQLKLLLTNEIVPNVAQLAWAVTTYEAVRSTFYLLPERTSSKDSKNNHVVLGYAKVSGKEGFYINDSISNRFFIKVEDTCGIIGWECDSRLRLDHDKELGLSSMLKLQQK